MTETEYNRLRKSHEEAKAAAASARGAMESLQERLKEKYEVNSLSEAKKLLKGKQTMESELARELDELILDYKTKFPNE